MEYKHLTLNGIYICIDNSSYPLIFRNKGYGIATSFISTTGRYYANDVCCTIEDLKFREATIEEVNALIVAETNYNSISNTHYKIY